MKRILGLIMCIMFISLASASTLETIKKNDCAQLHQICDNCSYVNITSIIYPNGTYEIIGLNMTKKGEDYNYTFCNTNLTGSYIYNTCGDLDGSRECENIRFEVNPIGFESTNARISATNRGIYLIFGLAALLFIGALFFNTDKLAIKLTLFLLFVLFLTLGLNMTFISLYNEIGDTQIGAIYDKIAAFSIYMFWFVFGLLIMTWVLTSLASLVDRKRIKEAEATGNPTSF